VLLRSLALGCQWQQRRQQQQQQAAYPWRLNLSGTCSCPCNMGLHFKCVTAQLDSLHYSSGVGPCATNRAAAPPAAAGCGGLVD
jgi:hypothetical protein